MGRTAGRSSEETRRLVLETAATAIRTHGVSVSLDEIARRAGVSKGGLIYHFPSKEALVSALAHDMLDSFRVSVRAHLDPADDGPGRLTRAFVHASLEPGILESDAHERVALMAQLNASAAAAGLAAADYQRWERDLAADGLPPDVLAVVVAAADGVLASPLWGATLDRARLDLLRASLLAMIDAAVPRPPAAPEA
ncbi:TetR/AcrR family transcriptional regulator [Micromonospora sp. CPCC 205561]|uniref:TetR/AcrR family transcriptional regulator n=1 Tax=Micromonospora sp. CPCC 205561 TaxID=3122407 RepID=UPI002FEECA15